MNWKDDDDVSLKGEIKLVLLAALSIVLLFYLWSVIK
jgi:hypothetical protein